MAQMPHAMRFRRTHGADQQGAARARKRHLSAVREARAHTLPRLQAHALAAGARSFGACASNLARPIMLSHEHISVHRAWHYTLRARGDSNVTTGLDGWTRASLRTFARRTPWVATHTR